MNEKILAFNGSPRPSGNSTHLLRAFLNGTGENAMVPEAFHSHQLNLEDCTGCLRCNVLKRCSISGDDWSEISTKILQADVLVFATPIYFHHLPASLKMVLDRFRSFAHVQITESGLIHTPYQKWKKDFVLILSQGSPDPVDAQPVIDLFRYICSVMGKLNKLHVIIGTRLAMVNQVIKTEDELLALYKKMKLPEYLAGDDFIRNRKLVEQCFELGKTVSKTS